MFEDLGLPSDGCITECSKCGRKLTPTICDPTNKRLLKACWKCRERIDVTDMWLENNKYSTHKGCGGGMFSFLDPDTFILMEICLKCGFQINKEEAQDAKARGEEVPLEPPAK